MTEPKVDKPKEDEPKVDEKNDSLSHIKIGEKLKLFRFDPMSPGSCFFMKHGTILFNNLMNYIRKLYKEYEYDEVMTPVICDKKLWEISGHYQKYKQNMFIIQKDEDDAYEFSLCPMNCPKHALMFSNQLYSYRDLPVRLCDFGALHRKENSGSLRGLTRVRLFHQDDAHIFCTVDQIRDEIKSVIKMIDTVYKKFNLKYEMRLSTRPDDYIGEIELWNKAEQILKECIGDSCVINEKDGAFYGPKIDCIVKDSLKREHQLGTIQLDFNLPSRFKLKYKSKNEGKTEVPVMIHRAILGSIERFIAILLESTAAKLPLWISPRQIAILPISDKFNDYAKSLKKELNAEHIDIFDNGLLGKRIEYCEELNYNLIFVVGKKEEASKTVSLRNPDKSITEMSLDAVNELIAKMCKE